MTFEINQADDFFCNSYNLKWNLRMEKKHCSYMDNIKSVAVLITILFVLSSSLSTGFAQSEQVELTQAEMIGFTQPEQKIKGPVNIGILFDGKDSRAIPFIASLRSELNALLGTAYNINVKDNHILNGQWSFEKIEDNYDKLVSNPEIRIIVGAGAITGAVIAKKKKYKKPVISIGIVDPIIQGLATVTDNKSGIRNLTYIMGNKSVIKDLETFHQVYPYNKLGFIYYAALNKTMTPEGWGKINRLMRKTGSQFIKIPVKKKVDEVFEYLDKVDAVYISYLGKFEGDDKRYLIEKLIERKVPSFGHSLTDTHAGALAAMAPDVIIKKITRRVSLNIEAILAGQNPADFKVLTEFDNNLTINMKTAAQIGFSPKFAILSQAELINEYYADTERMVNLPDVMKEAARKSLDIEMSKTYVDTAKHDIARAETDYRPYFSTGLNGVVIDEKRAEKSNGTQAELTAAANFSASQLIYSDQVLGNITSKEYLYEASLLDHKNTVLDVIFTAAEAYFKILKAKTERKIQKDNINLIKKNLNIAEQREVSGYSGRSDVLRWHSQLVTASTKFLAAKQEVILAKNELNRILNRRQDELFHVKDTSLNDDIFSIYSANTIEKYINNQKTLDIFTLFFIGQCIDNSYAIKELNEINASLERSAVSLKRKRYLPSISFSASQEHIFSRSGAGADIPGADPVDTPWTAGIYLSLPFYEGGSVLVDIKNLKLEIARIDKQKIIARVKVTI